MVDLGRVEDPAGLGVLPQSHLFTQNKKPFAVNFEAPGFAKEGHCVSRVLFSRGIK